MARTFSNEKLSCGASLARKWVMTLTRSYPYDTQMNNTGAVYNYVESKWRDTTKHVDK